MIYGDGSSKLSEQDNTDVSKKRKNNNDQTSLDAFGEKDGRDDVHMDAEEEEEREEKGEREEARVSAKMAHNNADAGDTKMFEHIVNRIKARYRARVILRETIASLS